MAVLTNTMMQGTAAISDEEEYFVKKSLKMHEASSANLTQEFKQTGNVRKWTYSVWVKRGDIPNEDIIWSSELGNASEFLRFNTDGTLQYGHTDGSSYIWNLISTAVFRDPTAWYHVVVRFDSAQAYNMNRCEIWVNGVQLTDFGTNTLPARWLDSYVNDEDYIHYINKSNQGVGDVIYADVRFVDGLNLGPAAFGKYDAADNWVPKAFELPRPNNNITWSSGLAKDDNSDTMTNAAYSFDGDLTNTVGGLHGGWTWTAPSSLKKVYSLRFLSASFNTTGIIKFNGKKIETDYNFGGSDDWYTVPFDILRGADYTLTSLSWNRNPGAGSNTNDYLRAVEVNGVILQDGVTDKTYAEWQAAIAKVNNGRNWGKNAFQYSDNGGSYATWNDPDEKGFSGRIAADGADNQTSLAINKPHNGGTDKIKWTVPGGHPIQGTNFKIYCYQPQGTAGITNTLSINGATAIPDTDYDDVTANDVGWSANIAIPAGGLTSLEMSFTYGSGHSWFGWYAIQVDGVVLTNGRDDVNSFHLKFEDTGTLERLTQDYLSNTDVDIGALPIYNTNAYGNTKESGYRSDPLSSHLVFAMPGDVLTDEHDEIKGSGSAKTVTNDGVVISTKQARHYGSSLYFQSAQDGTGMRLSCSSHADFNLHGGDWCVEGWFFNETELTSGQQVLIENGTAGTAGWSITRSNNSKLYFYSSNNEIIGTTNVVMSPNQEWYHVALVRKGSITTMYVDGTPRWESATDAADAVDGLWIGERSNGTLGFKGFMNDIRIYKGHYKYDGPFRPARRNDWTPQGLALSKTKKGFRGIQYGVVDLFTNQTWNNTKNNPHQAYVGTTLAAVAAQGFYGTDHIYWIDLGQSRTIEKFVWYLTSNGSSGAGDNSFIMFTSTNPASNGNTRCSGGCDVNTANTFSGSMTGDMVVTHDLTAGNTITARYIGLSNGSGGQPTKWKCTDYEFTDNTGGPAPAEPCSSVDSPTNFIPEAGDTGAGGTVNGTYPVLNPLQRKSGITLTQCNTVAKVINSHEAVVATMGIKTGKWYWEMTRGTGDNEPLFGIKLSSLPHATLINSNVGNPGFAIRGNEARYWDGTEYVGGLMAGVTQAEGETLGFAFDADAGKIWARKKDGNWANSGDPPNGTGTVGTGFHNDIGDDYWLPYLKIYNGDGHSLNFGQTPFVLGSGAPTGFKCLCSANLDDTFTGTDLNNGSNFFDVKTWDGDGVDGTEVRYWNFGPDLLWNKCTNVDLSHIWQDVVRGTGKSLDSDNADAQNTGTGYIESFESDGFDLEGSGGGNTDGRSYVSFGWDAGTAAATASTDGSVTPTGQWVNNTAGFSISQFTGTGSTITVGHGLSTAPHFVIQKCISHSANWNVYHKKVGNANRLVLNTTDAGGTGYWNNADPTNTVVAMTASIAENAKDYIMYCWAPIEGYSSFGKYQGNDNADGPYVYLGFRPAFIIFKDYGATANWFMLNAKQNTISGRNLTRTWLRPNTTEQGGNANNSVIDITSNGFKIKGNGADINASGNDYVYMAWAQHPAKIARAY